jgi:hypothetical protein
MRSLKLSEAKMKGVEIGGERSRRIAHEELQAIGKSMSKKEAYPKALSNAIGLIWCPQKGMECKDLGENTFPIHFPSNGRETNS